MSSNSGVIAPQAITPNPPAFDIAKLYERDISYEVDDVYAGISAGPNLVCHAGHSSYGTVMLMNIGNVTTANLTNDGISANFPVINSYGCNAGGFDLNDCIAEEMVSLATCASAYIGNSRYGWFTEGFDLPYLKEAKALLEQLGGSP